MPAGEILWFRLHCTLADVGILLLCALGMAGLGRSASWLSRPRWGDYAILTALGVSYTFVSELVNLGRGAWAYSELMPRVPGTPVGLLPLLQWILLPVPAAWLAARLARPGA